MERNSSNVENLELSASNQRQPGNQRTEPSQSGTNDCKNQKDNCKTKWFGLIILSLILIIILMAIFWSLDSKKNTSTSKGNSG